VFINNVVIDIQCNCTRFVLKKQRNLSGLGCIACCASKLPGVFGAFAWQGSGQDGVLNAAKLIKHHHSNDHKRAAATFFGFADDGLAGPSMEEMREQLRLLQLGTPVATKGSKPLAMIWCLREALLDIDRDFVRKAVTIAICRDARNQRLLIRFTGATSRLETRKGVLGIGRESGADADCIVAATANVFKNFCTPRRGAPIHGAGPFKVEDVHVDAQLLKHLQHIVEVIAVDEEAAELKAADIGRGRRASALELAPITPNLKFVTRDKAHGFRRILKRPFAADLYLHSILEDTLVRKWSVVQRIWNSPILSGLLKQRIKEKDAAPGGKAANLNAAKHRFESFAAPLGRMHIHLDEFLDMVQEVCDERRGTVEGQNCWDWLEGLDNEKIIQLAMVADCSDDVLVATRYVDSEDVDTSTLHDAAYFLLCRLDALFNKKQCLVVEGYTKHVLDILKKQRVFHGPRGEVTSIGGHDVENSTALQNCFRRMAAYVSLVADVVATEFPDYELLGSFKVFNLSAQEGRGSGSMNKPTTESLDRLAQAFTVPAAALKDQFCRVRPVAILKQNERPNVCNKVAWQEAIQSCQRHHGTKSNWGVDALLPVLWRYVGWTAATSGVEQNFSKALRLIGPQRGSLTPEREETVVKFAVYTADQKEVDDVIARSRAIWDVHYGAPRIRAHQRCDKGVPRISTAETERAWLKRRRDAAHDAGNEFGDPTALSVEAAEGGPGWTAGHDKEHAFQVQKRAKKQLQALQDGMLPPHEIWDGMDEAVAARKDKETKEDAKHKKMLTNNNALKRKPMRLKLKAGTVACISVAEPVASAVRRALDTQAVINRDLSLETQLLVVHDVTCLDKNQQWIAALTGTLVCCPEAVLSEIGPFLKYKAAIQKPMKLHLTNEFRTKHVLITSLLMDACQLPRSLWKLRATSAKGVKVLGGHHGTKSNDFLESITRITRSESRQR
jgi:hypothetical protein